MRFCSLIFLFVLGCDNVIPDDVPRPQEANSENESQDRDVPELENADTGWVHQEESNDELNNSSNDSSIADSDPVDQDGDGWFDQEDCDDLDSRIHPGAPEFCDGIDTDCDGRIDPPDSVDALVWYRDDDRDGFGLSIDTLPGCSNPGPEWVLIDGDCDDSNADVHPEAEEVCDGLDNDCDGVIDPADSEGRSTWYFDLDGDGFGDPHTTEVACASPDEFWVEKGMDCNDSDAYVYPGAEEYCDEIDSDCDGVESTEIASFFYSDGTREDVTEELWGRTYDVVESGTLRICEGHWLSRVLIDASAEEDVVIQGVGNVVIDAQLEGTVIEVVGELNALSVRNVDLIRGSALRGGGIYASAVDLFLQDVDLRGNEAQEFGGAVFVDEGNISLQDSQIMENKSKGMFLGGGGIYLGLGTLSATDSTLTDNHSEGLFSIGGGIYTLAGEVYLNNTRLKRNSSIWFGGAVYLGAGYLDLQDAWFEGNEATTGGGAYVGGDVFMLHSLFLNNNATENGGGLFLRTASGAATLVCDSLDSGSHGFLHNDAGNTGGAVQIASIEFSSISSDGCDWGSGFSDNSGGDLRMAPFDAEAGSNATFLCDGLDCVGEVELVLEP